MMFIQSRRSAAFLGTLAISATGFAAQPDDSFLKQIWSTFDPEGEFDNDLSQKLADGPFDYEGPSEVDPFEGGGDERGGPPNDSCSSATLIPGNAVTFFPALLNTTGATNQLCELAESCEVGGVGSSNGVWYVYTPAKDGWMTIDTHGSSYNTVLSVWNGCPGGFPPNCASRIQLACNDDYLISDESEITMAVQAGETYRIRAADYNSADGGGFLDFNFRYYPPNDVCADATSVAGPGFTETLSTQNAQGEQCESNETCELNDVGVSNAVWYKYTPSCDGSISINTNGSSYDTVLSIWDGCGEWVSVDWPCNTASELACDDDSGTGVDSQILNFPVTTGTQYIIKAADYNGTQGGGTLVFNFAFSGAGEPNAAITSPAAFGCVCGGPVSVIGTATAGFDPLLGWELDYRAASGGAWTTIATGSAPVNNASLGSWNATALPQGYYVLRLSVQNHCGTANTAVQVVFLDQAFDALDLREPDAGDIFGGVVCFDGTAWDNCFDSYQLMFRASGSPTFSPVDPTNPTYNTAVTNDPLGSWNTLSPAVPDGNYDVMLSSTDLCGHPASIIRTVEIDNTPPIGVITSPLNCDDVSGVVQIIGTANDANLAGWALQYTGGQINTWSTLASGSTPVVNGLLGTLDTSRLTANCPYTLRLLVSDHAIVNCLPTTQQAEYTVSVTFGGGGTTDCPADLDGNGTVDITDLAILLSVFGSICP